MGELWVKLSAASISYDTHSDASSDACIVNNDRMHAFNTFKLADFAVYKHGHGTFRILYNENVICDGSGVSYQFLRLFF